MKDVICSGCALENDEMGSPGLDCADIVVLGGFPSEEDAKKGPFRSRRGQIVRTVMDGFLREMAGANKPKVAYTYAVQCCPKSVGWKVSAETIKQCSPKVLTYLDRVRPKVIIATGSDAVKSLGFKETISAMRGGVYSVRLSNGDMVTVLATYHITQVDKTPGLFPVFKNDIAKALRLYRAGSGEEPMAMDLRLPIVFDDVMRELDYVEQEINAYTIATGRKCALAVDTETTSLTPYNPADRVIMVSMSCKKAHGLAYPFEHRDAPYTPEHYTIIRDRTEKILSSPKVYLVYNNGKFDHQWLKFRYGLNIHNPAFDTMLLEHVLEEDKKGEYSLKSITKDRLPEFGRYEEELDAVKAKVLELKAAEVKEKYTSMKQAIEEELFTSWVALDGDDKRLSVLSKWVEHGAISLTDCADLHIVKYKKSKTGQGTILKKYTTTMLKVFSNIPLQLVVETMDTVSPAVLETKAEMESLVMKVTMTYEEIPLDVLIRYAAIDAITTRMIFAEQFQQRIPEDEAIIAKINKTLKRPLATKPVLDAYYNITNPLSHVLADMEYNGVTVDRDRIVQYMDVVGGKIDEYLDRMYTIVGYKFKTSASAPDVAKILYEDMKLPILKQTDTGSPCVDADTLKELSDMHENEFLNTILAYRKLDKCLNTYLKSWYQRSESDGRIHCSYNQIGTATYRLSSSKPNLQNVPFFLKEANLNLKALFIPDSEDFDIYDLDISNAEMRVLCGYSRDAALIDVFLKGMCIHCITAAGISPYDYDDIYANKENKSSDQYKQRQIAKKVNFGTIYVMGAATLKKKLWADMRISVTEEEAQEYLDKFFRTYPGVKDYIEMTQAFVKKHKFTYTYTGRRRRFPYANLSFAQLNKVCRQAVNARVQTSSADLVASNVIDIDASIKPLGGRTLLTVHDSICFQLPKGTTGVAAMLDKAVIENTAIKYPWLPVVWKYDVGMGRSYGETKNHVY